MTTFKTLTEGSNKTPLSTYKLKKVSTPYTKYTPPLTSKLYVYCL